MKEPNHSAIVINDKFFYIYYYIKKMRASPQFFLLNININPIDTFPNIPMKHHLSCLV